MTMRADELPGTVLHYDFQTYANENQLKDLSGNGHHGVISGEIVPVEVDNCKGLDFGGKDGQILPLGQENLRLSGAISIFVKFRITPEAAAAVRQQSPLLFGTTDSLGVHRNYTLFFDYGITLTLNVANGINCDTFDLKDIADGKIHSAAFIIAPPLMMIYCDGECKSNSNSLNIMPDKSIGNAPVAVGKWGAGTFPGEVYDLRLFNRMLSPHETLQLSGIDTTDAPCTIEFDINHSDVRKSLDWTMKTENFPKEATAIALTIDGKNVFKRPLTDNEKAASFAILEEESNTAQFELGTHNAVVATLDDNGEILKSSSRQFEIREIDCPEKFYNELGISTEVLPPWTPMTATQTEEGVQVTMWNRVYRYAAKPLSGTIYSGAELFTRQSSLDISINGSKNPLTENALELLSSEKHQVVLKQSSQNESAELTALHTIEYDGFDHIIVKLTAKEDMTVDALDFVFPMVSKYCAGTIRTLTDIEALTTSRFYAFTPLLMICDESRGLHYLADSDEFWFPKNNPQAITISDNRSEESLFSIHPIATATAMHKGDTFTYEFALTGMPVRPMTRSAWKNRYLNLLPYCGELQSLSNEYKGKKVLDYFADGGMKGFIIWRDGDAFAYPPIPGTKYGDDVTALVKEAHARNLTVFPYCVSFLFSEFAPEWNERRLYCKQPMRDWAAIGDFLEQETGKKQHAYTTCNSRQYQDLMLYRVKEAILKTDIDGVYLDTTASSYACSESAHPHCGYVGQDGLRHTTANGFQTREMMKRLHTLIWQLKGEKGVMDLHFSFACNAPAAAWATSLWCGEALKEPPNLQIYKSVSPFDFRLGYTGYNIGVSNEFLYYTTRCPFLACAAMSMVHGIPTRPADWNAVDAQMEIWKERDALGCDDAEFIPYWDEKCPVKAKEDGIFVSCYKRKDGSLVIVIANLTEKTSTVTLKSNIPGLTLPAPFELASQGYKLIDN